MRRGLFPVAALASVLGATSLAEAACAVRGEHVSLGDVTVRAGNDKFKLAVDDVIAIAHPERLKNAPVDVLTSIHFRSLPDTIPYVLTAPVVASPVELGAGVALSNARSDRGDLVVDVSFEPFVIHDVPVPCRAVSIEAIPAGIPLSTSTDPLLEQKASLDPASYHPTHPSSWLLFQGPGSGAHVRLEGDVELYRLLAPPVGRDRWVHVLASFPSVALDGWVRSDLISHDDVGEIAGGLGFGSMCGGGGHGWPARTVRAGTFVYDKPDGSAWATVPRQVDLEIGQAVKGWAPIRRIDGLSELNRCEPMNHAWVAVSSLVPEEPRVISHRR